MMGIDYEGLIKLTMQKNPITIDPDASFYEARAIVRDKGIRHLPVVDKQGRLVGIITDTDIREAAPSDASALTIQELQYLLGKIKVASIMTPQDKLVTITPDITIEEAVQLMHDNKIGCLPVMEKGRLAGILTATDIMAIFVDIFGLKLQGTRITVALEDVPGKMLGVLEVMRDHGVNVISIMSPTFLVQGKRVAAVRIATQDFEAIVEDLQKKGYEVLSTDRWTPKS